MSNSSSIEWTEATWNPVTGCTEVSPGCDHCYARTFAERFRGVRGHPYEQGFDLKLWPERLQLPFHWKKPRRIFVNSMSDLFHKDVPDKFIVQVLDTMLSTPQHTYQILTKRPSRLVNTSLMLQILMVNRLRLGHGAWPRHIQIGVSVESQAYAWRIDKLRQGLADPYLNANPDDGAAVPPLFVSAEPLLGPLDLDLSHISWLIAGAESGHGARPMDEDWVRSLRDQCQAAGAAFFYKQKLVNGKKAPTPQLDGRTWTEFPKAGEVLG